jgi:DNA-binding LacI/PurR family transcriptional regulator
MHWVKSGNLPEAIYAGSDEGAMGTYLALNQAGKRIPEDVAVVGFDDMSLARYLTPPLTTIKAPTEKVGRMAVRQLIRVIRTGSADPLSLLPTELVIRQSCGCK